MAGLRKVFFFFFHRLHLARSAPGNGQTGFEPEQRHAILNRTSGQISTAQGNHGFRKVVSTFIDQRCSRGPTFEGWPTPSVGLADGSEFPRTTVDSHLQLSCRARQHGEPCRTRSDISGQQSAALRRFEQPSKPRAGREHFRQRARDTTSPWACVR